MNLIPKAEEQHAHQSVNQRISRIHAESGARQFVGINQTYNINEGNSLDLLPYADQAPYNSRANEHKPCCLPNTRISVLQEIYRWADRVDQEDGRCIFWLNGWAGTGKSTIARTVACKYDCEERLGASFFFSKCTGDVGHAGKFFTSIAVQLAEKLPPIRSHICGAIARHSKIDSQALSDQWHRLILQPLSKLDSGFPHASILLVIDALDECDDDDDIETIVQLLAESRSLKTINLRVFLTSRPEIPIRLGFQLTQDIDHEDFLLHNVSPPLVNNDISIFLVNNFETIRQRYHLDQQWPGEQIITSLVQKSSGLFIWAATACRFIYEGGEFAVNRLEIILENKYPGNNSAQTSRLTPEDQLNQIYLTVLGTSVHNYQAQERGDQHNRQSAILGAIVLLFSPLPFLSLTKLLGCFEKDIERALGNLHSILSIPEDKAQPIRLHHPSFRDFLLSCERCGSNFWVDDKQEHWILAQKCMQLMSATLKRDICDLRIPGILRSDIDINCVERCLQPEVQYACVYWVQHVLRGDNRLHNGGFVHKFLKEHFLHWLEAMALMEKITEAVHAMVALESLVKHQAPFPEKHRMSFPTMKHFLDRYIKKAVPEDESVRNEELHVFVYDAKRFAIVNQSLIRDAPLQIYCSALLFAPEESDIKRQFKDEIPAWIDGLPFMEDRWSPLEQMLEGHCGTVLSVAFSPDGTGKIVSGSSDKTVRMWDVASARQLKKLEGHTDSVYCVAFSPDGCKIVSGSGDRTMRVWDAASGQQREPMKLEGHYCEVYGVAFSPDGSKIVSGSGDYTVRVWDVASGMQRQELRGHSRVINSVAFSPNGSTIVSGSSDKTMRVWDAASGQELLRIKGSLGRIYSVAFSPDGSKIVSGSGYDIARPVRVWDAASGRQLKKLKHHSGCIFSVVFSPDGRKIASGSADGTVQVWDAGSGQQLQNLEGHTGYIKSVAFSLDSGKIVSGSGDCTVRVWPDAVRERQLQGLGRLDYIYTISFSLDGSKVVSGSRDSTVRVWDAATGRELQMLRGHSSSINSVAFSPDGSKIVSGSDDMTVRVWNADSGRQLRKIMAHSCVEHTVFSSDGSKIVSGSYGDAWVWDAASGRQLGKIGRGYESNINSIAFSPDSGRILLGFNDNTAQEWDAASMQQLEVSGAFSPEDSQRSSYDRTIVHTTYAMDTSRHWITHNGLKILYIPPDFRPCSNEFATSGSSLAIGAKSGRVIMLRFQPSTSIDSI